MQDADDRATIRQDLQRYRNILKTDTLEDDGRKALHMLVKEAEDRLAELEGRAKAAV